MKNYKINEKQGLVMAPRTLNALAFLPTLLHSTRQKSKFLMERILFNEIILSTAQVGLKSLQNPNKNRTVQILVGADDIVSIVITSHQLTFP
jgi:hypothetical protein